MGHTFITCHAHFEANHDQTTQWSVKCSMKDSSRPKAELVIGPVCRRNKMEYVCKCIAELMVKTYMELKQRVKHTL